MEHCLGSAVESGEPPGSKAAAPVNQWSRRNLLRANYYKSKDCGMKIGHSPRTPKSSEKLILFPNKNRIFLCKALHYSACRRRLDVGSRTLLSNRDFCQARAITTLHYRNRCAAEVVKDVLPMIRFSGSEVRSRQGDCSPAQRKKAIHKSRHQDIPPQARNRLPEKPSRVWLAVLLLANLFIFAGIIHSIARGLLT